MTYKTKVLQLIIHFESKDNNLFHNIFEYYSCKYDINFLSLHR